MTIQPNQEVKLYAHEPRSLIPLLKSHLPRSLPVLSTIYENVSLSNVKEDISRDKERLRSDRGYDVVWATFPPDLLPILDNGRGNGHGIAKEDEGGKDALWAIVIRMQEGDSIHLRFYCSAESTTPVLSNANEATSDERIHEQGDESEDEEMIQEFVGQVTRGIVDIYGQEITLGAISSRWNKVMRGIVDARELVECSVFLSPLPGGSSSNGSSVGEGRRDEEVLADLGLTLDIARKEDIPLIQSTCDVPRPLAYYTSRSQYSTVIREIESGKAVCWVVLHADGSLGALYTIPSWRRKGLAEVVVRQNIRHRLTRDSAGDLLMESEDNDSNGKEKEKERRNFCYVFKGNTASERLWVKLGWEEGWGVRWIVNRKVEETRGKVARFSHADE